MKSELLINLSGRRVRVAAERVDGLLGRGFRRAEAVAPRPATMPATEPAPAPIVLDDLTRSELWALCKQEGLDDRLTYRDSAEAMKAALRAL